MDQLSKLQSKYGEYVPAGPTNSVPVFDVRTPHLLNQAAGYLKHVLAKLKPCHVFYRGERRLYGTLVPSLYRGIGSIRAKGVRETRLTGYINEITQSSLRHVPAAAREPLLQHYGINTRWIDLVDNVWIALWFACHKVTVSGRRGEYVHFDRLEARDGIEHVYILLLCADAAEPDVARPGIYVGPTTTTVDLRVSCPSFYVRPHAQHGLLLRRTKLPDVASVNYSDLVVGRLLIHLSDALAWLGDGKLLSVRSLFPPPCYDNGYDILLRASLPKSKLIGVVTTINA